MALFKYQKYFAFSAFFMVSEHKHEKASASRESTARRECRPALYLGFRKISFTASVLPKKNNRHTLLKADNFCGCGRKISFECCSCSICSISQDVTVFCLSCSYSDPSFYEECKTEYLKQREEYRATGIKKKKQKITSNI